MHKYVTFSMFNMRENDKNSKQNHHVLKLCPKIIKVLFSLDYHFMRKMLLFYSKLVGIFVFNVSFNSFNKRIKAGIFSNLRMYYEMIFQRKMYLYNWKYFKSWYVFFILIILYFFSSSSTKFMLRRIVSLLE